MKKFFPMLIILSLLFSGCDEIEGSSKSNDSIQETTCEVLRINYGSLEEDEIFSYDCAGNKRIQFMIYTKAVRDRDSCSGFINVNAPQEIRIGDLLTVRYKPSDASYVGGTTIIRAREIEALPSTCWKGNTARTQTLDQLNGRCDPCDFFN